MSGSGYFAMDFGSAELFQVDVFAGYRLDDSRAGNDHVAFAFDHHNKVGQGRRIYGHPGAGAHHAGNLRNKPRGGCIAVKHAGHPFGCEKTFVQSAAAGII